MKILPIPGVKVPPMAELGNKVGKLEGAGAVGTEADGGRAAVDPRGGKAAVDPPGGKAARAVP